MTGGRVVVGVSGSPSSKAALRRGSQEAWRSGRVLVPVHTWEPPEGEIVYARSPSPPLAALWERQAGQRLAGVLAEVLGLEPQPDPDSADPVRFTANGLRVEPLVVRAPPGTRCRCWRPNRRICWSSAGWARPGLGAAARLGPATGGEPGGVPTAHRRRAHSLPRPAPRPAQGRARGFRPGLRLRLRLSCRNAGRSP
ncbi:hypothetical protein GXW82_05320 [Streptacidiphilus sp. 4-A2]|nr:hypothetical protein [Streptacidiphilus sp. 4-A2]